ncbi:M81 family metallopeptidase [Roseateles toxinivorans]|uniref:Microcystinase C n=1 Tax=Roseateles toxinivorans TaxID=270368 RepID=A0A4R6QPU1_9BURK|nr:M81 family metallopeptidase [Roseateles toxinivorans]TDP73026.1 microcystin degradation protein MlrC [Roseateles toxinivorans]
MKFFVAQLETETNTFAAAPTGWGGFEACGIYRGDASVRAPDTTGAFMQAIRSILEADGHCVVEGLCASAEPFGRTVREVYESLREQMLADLRMAMPVDAVQLLLHGAMVADGYDDCEGDLMARVREIIGPDVPFGVELDLHCHFTERMRASADVIIAFKEYPHTDGVDRARELYRILLDMQAGRLRPTTAVFDCKMVGMWHTTREPMAGFVKRLQSFEGHDGVLSVSLGHGFPWGDVPESGAKLWVVTDNDTAKAQRLAEQLGREFWELRALTGGNALALDDALDQALQIDGGPVVLADVADNPGGGATSDSTFILRRLIERGIGNAVIGAFWDLGAIQICKDAGVGAVIDLRVGGKCGPASGAPVDLRVTVRAVVEAHSQSAVAMGVRAPMGTAVWVESAAVPGGLHLLLASVRGQVFGTDAFTGLGLSLADKGLVVVKSSQHFHAEFAPIAKAVLYAATPGAINPDFARIPYVLRDLDYWPRVETITHQKAIS